LFAFGNTWVEEVAFCFCVTGDQGSTARPGVPLFKSPLDQFKGLNKKFFSYGLSF